MVGSWWNLVLMMIDIDEDAGSLMAKLERFSMLDDDRCLQVLEGEEESQRHRAVRPKTRTRLEVDGGRRAFVGIRSVMQCVTRGSGPLHIGCVTMCNEISITHWLRDDV